MRLTSTKVMERPKCGKKKGSAHDPKYTSLSVKHGGGSVMAWSCIAAPGVGSIIVIDDVTHDGSNRMNSEVYKNTLDCQRTEKCGIRNLSCSKTMNQNTLPTHQRTSLGRKKWKV